MQSGWRPQEGLWVSLQPSPVPGPCLGGAGLTKVRCSPALEKVLQCGQRGGFMKEGVCGH